jgi:hypothetical protein
MKFRSAGSQPPRAPVEGMGFSPYIKPGRKNGALAPAGTRPPNRQPPLIALAILWLFAVIGVAAQTPPQTPAAPQPPTPLPPAQPDPQPKGQVIFSRSIDENGLVTSQAGPAAAHPEIKTVSAPSAEDADRQAVAFTDLDLDVHLRAAEQQIAVRALLTVRNDGKSALARIPLQISSSLDWERIRVDSNDAVFTVATLNSDTDHTGQLHEAAIPLAAPLAPGAIARLDVTYSGAIPPNARRLLAIGTPDDMATHSDWDRIGVDFTGLRGFGNVVWYPVSSVPAILGDSARVFDEIGNHKLRLVGAHFRLRLTVEFPAGQPPVVAVINGHPAPLTVTDAAPGQEVPGVATADSGPATLGFEAPSLFVAVRTPHDSPTIALWTLPEDSASAEPWTTAASAVAPFLQGWLGEFRSQLTLLDLPDPHDAPFETGALLAVPIRPAPPDQLEGILVHAFTHAFLNSPVHPPPAWLDEGVATFMGTLWTEKHQGREQALGSLESARPALALAEPESPGENAGQPLARATSPVYYRTKAAYVLWMLRDIAGESTLSAALRAYDPSKDAGTASAHSAFEKLLEQSGDRHDLAWFFADWVDADHGLPDLSIESVFPSSPTPDSWLVTVNLANAGYAAAEVPVIVRSQKTSVTQRVLIPARSKISQRVLIQGKPTQVQLNDGTVPETQASVHITNLDEPDQAPASSPPPSQ